MEGNKWINGAHYEHGDSGGPVFVLGEVFGTPEAAKLFAEHGIVVGVVSGPAVLESLS